MKRALAFVTALGAALFFASAAPVVAAGEAPSPELDRFYLRLASGPRDLSRMAACLVNQNADGARQLFDLVPDARAHQEALREFHRHGGNCLFVTWELRSSSLMFMGAVAEHLIQMDGPVHPAASSGARGEAIQIGGGSHLWTWRNLSDSAAARLLPLARCLLAGHPDQVQAILDARQTSDGERKLFNALNDEIDGCIPVGESWTLQPQMLRAGLAIAYYTSARAAGASANDGAAD